MLVIVGDGLVYPLSDEKRAELRLKGIVPFSRDFLAAGAIIGLALTMLSLGESLFVKLRLALVTATAPSTESIEDLTKQSFSLYSELVLIVVSGVLFFILLFGLFQNRFLFNFSLIFGGFDRRRPLSGNNCDLNRRIRNFLLGALKYGVLWIMILVYGSVIFDTVQIKAFTVTQSMTVNPLDRVAATEAVTAVLVTSFYWIFFLTVTFMAFIAICSLVLSRLQFANDYQMSREEVEAQAREGRSMRAVEYESEQ